MTSGGLRPGESRDATGKWAVGGSGGSARQQAAKRRGKTAKGTAKSGANDLYHVAQAAGISEAKLLRLNPQLRKLAGTGRSVPKGVTVATTAATAKTAARSQASRKHAIGAQAARGQTKLAAASAARKAAAAKPATRKAAAAKPAAAKRKG